MQTIRAFHLVAELKALQKKKRNNRMYRLCSRSIFPTSDKFLQALLNLSLEGSEKALVRYPVVQNALIAMTIIDWRRRLLYIVTNKYSPMIYTNCAKKRQVRRYFL